MLTVKLPIDIYDKVYWIRPMGGELIYTEIIVDGYDVRLDSNLDPFLVVIFRCTRSNESFRYKFKDVIIVKTMDEVKKRMTSIRKNNSFYPLAKPQYEDR